MARTALLLFLVVIIGVFQSVAVCANAQTPAADMLLDAKQKIARIRARSCAGGMERSATAFVWPDSAHVVTARHVVAGCTEISMIFPNGKSYAATPERELKLRDLLLLRLDRSSDLAPMQVAEGIPPINSRVAAMGYALGAPTIDSKLLDVTVANSPPGSKLKDMLDDNVRAKLRASGELDLETFVLRLDGNLLPGLSGAPLIASNGLVFGVGSGGLQEGAGGVVWAVRASYLGQLPSAPVVNSIQAIQRASGLSFADQSPQIEVEQVRCGSMNLKRSRTVHLSELSQNSDDRVGLLQLSNVLGSLLLNAGELEFVVWVDGESGASIAIPAGTTLDSGDTACVAHVSEGVDIFVRAAVISPEYYNGYNPSVQAASLEFKREMASNFHAPMFPDLGFTYPVAMMRGDGFVVRRSAFNGLHPSQEYGKAIFDYAFLTHMTRGREYIGVAATRRDISVDIQAMQQCNAQPNAPGCQELREIFAGWGKAALAVHLATMPPI